MWSGQHQLWPGHHLFVFKVGEGDPGKRWTNLVFECILRIAATCERAPSVRGDTPIFFLAEVADFVARSHPEFSQKLAKLSVRHVRAMKFSVYRRCAGGTVDSLKHLRLGPQGGRRVYFRIAVGLRTAGRLGRVCRRRGAVSEGTSCPRRCIAQRCLAGACRMTATIACF